MSNGPYGQLECRCGAVALLVCGASLGVGLDARGDAVTFWPLEAIQIGRGVDERDVLSDARGGNAWECRRCHERLLTAHDEDGIAVLPGQPEDSEDPTSELTASRQRRLEALGYRMVSGPAD